MFDFWYEFRLVVPKGYTRFLGKLSELTDMGVEVHFFTGNHDLWCGDYLTRECGVTIHREPVTTEIYGKEFYLAHGDGLGDPDKKFKLLRTMFHSRTLQTLFSAIHPRWSMDLGLNWAKHSRLKREGGKEPDYMGEDKEFLVLYTKEYLKNLSVYSGYGVKDPLEISRREDLDATYGGKTYTVEIGSSYNSTGFYVTADIGADAPQGSTIQLSACDLDGKTAESHRLYRLETEFLR